MTQSLNDSVLSAPNGSIAIRQRMSPQTQQKPGGHPNFRENALAVRRPFSELSESSGVFSEQLWEFEIPFSEYEMPFSEWDPTT